MDYINIEDEKLREYLEDLGDDGISRIDLPDDHSVMVVIRKGTYDTLEEMEDEKEELEEEFEDAFVYSMFNGPSSFYGLSIPQTNPEGSD